MPELLRKQTLGCSILGRSIAGRSLPGGSLRGWLLGCAVSLAVTPAFSWAESIPAGVRACAGETNADARLACYDKEVGRFLAPGEKSVTRTTPVAPTAGPIGSASSAASTTGTPGPAISNTGTATAPSPTTPAAAGSASDDPKHLTARVLSIERIPNEMILHLDNGQVWQEVQAVAGDLSLREGDTVKIDKHFGSYWLSGPHVSSMKVRQKS